MKLTKFLGIILCLAVLQFNQVSHAQSTIQNMPEHDSKQYYFGITFGVNMSAYKLSYTADFANNDTLNYLQPQNGPGFTMGILGNLRLSKMVTLRFIPALTFANKGIYMEGKRTPLELRNVESIYASLPLQLKFNSDRIKNFRFYGLLGSKFDFDLASNAKSRRLDEWIKIKPYDIGAEIGFGFEFYFPNFILSPEIKLSQGFMDLHSKDPFIPMSNAVDLIRSRTIMFSLHIEG